MTELDLINKLNAYAMSNSPLAFCQKITETIEEPIAGTAPRAKHYIFMSWPKSRWGYDALDAKGLPNELKDWLNQQNQTYGKTAFRLIHQKTRKTAHVRIFLLPGGIHYAEVPLSELMDVLTAHFQGNPPPKYLQPPLTSPVVFICTNGRHDKCCAKFGQRIFKQTRQTVSTRESQIDVWESTHLGGHRFAATSMVFPVGHAYGRLYAEDISPWLECLEQKKVYAPAFRGNTNLELLEQTAEAYIQQYGYRKKWDSQIELSKVQEISETQVRFKAKVIQKNAKKVKPITLEVNLIKKSFTGPASCNKLDAPEERIRWVLKSLNEI